MKQLPELKKYADEIEFIFAGALARLDQLPAEFKQLAQALLQRSNPLKSGAGANVISYLLPYWLRERTGCPLELCRELAVGNILAMLRFFVLDDVMDGGAGRLEMNTRDALVLQELLQGLFQRQYERHFVSDPALWKYNDRYKEEWALAVASELKQPIDPHDAGQLARKAAPVKLCAAASLLRMGQQEDIPLVEEAIELALAVLQLSDDWADWQEDLPHASGNGFLSLVREVLGLPTDAVLQEETVKKAIYHHQAVGRLAELSAAYEEQSSRLGVSSELLGFQRGMTKALDQEARAVEESVNRLASEGGFYYFLANNQKK